MSEKSRLDNNEKVVYPGQTTKRKPCDDIHTVLLFVFTIENDDIKIVYHILKDRFAK